MTCNIIFASRTINEAKISVTLHYHGNLRKGLLVFIYTQA